MVERTCCKDDENVKGGGGIGKAVKGSTMLNNIFFINITYFCICYISQFSLSCCIIQSIGRVHHLSRRYHFYRVRD